MSGAARSRWPFIFFLLSLAVNVLSIPAFYHVPYFDSLSREYFDRAENILAGKGDIEYYRYQGTLHSQPAIFRPPGYSYLIAGFRFVFGHSLLAFTIFQIILLSLFSPLYYLITSDLFSDPRFARLTTLLMIFFLPFFRLAIFREPGVFVGPMLFIGAYFLYKQRYFFSGLLIGLSTLFREDAILIWPFLFLMVLISLLLLDRKEAPVLRIRESATALSLLLVGFAAAVLPWLVRNSIYFHKFPYFCTPKAGTVLVQGIAEYDVRNRFHLAYLDNDLVRAEGYESWFPKADERNKIRLERAKQIILENPVWYSGVMLRRIPQYVFFIGGGGRTAPFMEKAKSFLYGQTSLSSLTKELVINFRHLWFTIFAAIQISLYYVFWFFGSARMIKEKRLKLWLLLLLIPLSYMTHIVHHVEPRYFVPAIYSMIPVSAYGIGSLSSLWRKKKIKADQGPG